MLTQLSLRTEKANGQLVALPSAIITGAASGLGRAIALRLARDGWRVALADINDDGSRETLDLVRAAGGDGRVEHLDVAEIDDWRALRDRLQSDWPSLDLLVNNVGVGCAGEVGEFPIEDWRWAIDINLFGTINGCHTMIDWLKENPRGAKIVNVASVAAFVSAPAMAAYNVTKGGILSFSETLYTELMPHNVGVTAVFPGFFPSQLVDDGRFQHPRQRAAAAAHMADARISADDVADAVVRAMARRQFYVVLPFRARLYWRLKRLVPGMLLKFIAWSYGSRVARKRPKSERVRRNGKLSPRKPR